MSVPRKSNWKCVSSRVLAARAAYINLQRSWSIILVEIENGVLPYSRKLKSTPWNGLLNILDVINDETWRAVQFLDD